MREGTSLDTFSKSTPSMITPRVLRANSNLGRNPTSSSTEGESYNRAPHHSTHDSLFGWVQQSRKKSSPPLQDSGLPSPEFHKISSTRSWITSPPIWISMDPSKPAPSHPSDRALSYPNRGFNRASNTSSAPSSSLRGIWRHGSRCSQCLRRVPHTTSGAYTSGPEGQVVHPRSFPNTPHGFRTRRRYV